MSGKYKVCLVLGRDRYVDLSDSKNLFNDKRAFSIHKWDPDIKYHTMDHVIEKNESGRQVRVRKHMDVTLGGWYKWLHFSGVKWRRYEKIEWGDPDQKRMMIKAHMFWEEEKEFTNWIGDEMYGQIFTDLL